MSLQIIFQLIYMFITIIKGDCNHLGSIPMDTCYHAGTYGIGSVYIGCINSTHYIYKKYNTTNCSGQRQRSDIAECKLSDYWPCNCDVSTNDCRIATTETTAETVAGLIYWSSFKAIINQCITGNTWSYKLICKNDISYLEHKKMHFGTEKTHFGNDDLSTIYYHSPNCAGEPLDEASTASISWNCSAQVPQNENPNLCTHVGEFATDSFQTSTRNVIGSSRQTFYSQYTCNDEYSYNETKLDHSGRGCHCMGCKCRGPIICNISNGCNCRGSIENCHLATYERDNIESYPNVWQNHYETYVLNVCVMNDGGILWDANGVKNGSEKKICSDDLGIQTIYYSDTQCQDEIKYSIIVDGCGTENDSFKIDTTTNRITSTPTQKKITVTTTNRITSTPTTNRITSTPTQKKIEIDIILVCVVTVFGILCCIVLSWHGWKIRHGGKISHKVLAERVYNEGLCTGDKHVEMGQQTTIRETPESLTTNMRT